MCPTGSRPQPVAAAAVEGVHTQGTHKLEVVRSVAAGVVSVVDGSEAEAGGSSRTVIGCDTPALALGTILLHTRSGLGSRDIQMVVVVEGQVGVGQASRAEAWCCWGMQCCTVVGEGVALVVVVVVGGMVVEGGAGRSTRTQVVEAGAGYT